MKTGVAMHKMAVLACALVVVGVQPGRAMSAIEVMERAQERFARYRTFSARIHKEFHWAALDRSSSREGRMYLRRPDEFRVEMEDGSLVVADGEAIWTYTPRNEQAIVSPYQADLQTPWEILMDYSGRFRPIATEQAELDGRSCHLLIMEPYAETTQVVQLKVWIDRRRWYLRRVEQFETNGNVTTYTLRGVETDRRLDDSLFEFVVPEGTDIIDRRPAPPPANGGR